MEYSIRGYGDMIADEVRFDAYRSALRKAVRPGATVLDLGAGPCILGLTACQCGAGRVIAVDADESLSLGQEIVTASGYLPRFEFLKGLSTKIKAPTRCDVVVSDLRGVLPLYTQHIPSIIDVRQRWLAEGGVLIPQNDSIYIAIVSNTQVFDEHYSAWRSDLHDWRFEPARRLLANTTRKVNLGAGDLLTTPALWATLDYRTVTEVNHRGTVQWTIERDGVGHGLAVWFESEMFDGVHFSSRPGDARVIYGQMYFPWPQPVPLAAADSVQIALRCQLLEGADNYLWSWNSLVNRHQAVQGSVEFKQSTFQGQILASDRLPSLRLDAIPVLLPEGQAARKALTLMDGKTSSESIASQLAEEFPNEFSGLAQAVKFVTSMYERFWR